MLTGTEFRAIPKSIWALGFVSLLMDTASESIHSLLPIFMVASLGASMTVVGLVEGFAEATALIVRIFSGVLSDYFRRHKTLTMVGYGLAAFCKPLFPLSSNIAMVFTARLTDRIGKGIRGAPRDALIGEIAPPKIRGACFGLRQSMDTIGAVLGPLMAMVGMAIFAGNIRAVFWLALIPAIASFLTLWWFVHEPERAQAHSKKSRLHFSDVKLIEQSFWYLVLVGFILGLARFSDAFLIIKGKSTGISIYYVPVVLIFMNVVYAACAYPAGVLSDRVSRKTVLALGIALFIASDIVLGFANNWWQFFVGIGLQGIYLGFTQGLFATMITDFTDEKVRGTAFGIFNCATGLAMLLASVGAGLLWDTLGAAFMFYVSAGFASLSLCLLLFLLTKRSRSSSDYQR